MQSFSIPFSHLTNKTSIPCQTPTAYIMDVNRLHQNRQKQAVTYLPVQASNQIVYFLFILRVHHERGVLVVFVRIHRQGTREFHARITRGSCKSFCGPGTLHILVTRYCRLSFRSLQPARGRTESAYPMRQRYEEIGAHTVSAPSRSRIQASPSSQLPYRPNRPAQARFSTWAWESSLHATPFGSLMGVLNS